MKLSVSGIIFRRKGNEIETLTQLRLVQNPSYDPLYDRTGEAAGGLIELSENGWPEEDIVSALFREVAEECGVPGFQPLATHGVSGQTIWTTDKGDEIFCVEPFTFVMQMGQLRRV